MLNPKNRVLVRDRGGNLEIWPYRTDVQQFAAFMGATSVEVYPTAEEAQEALRKKISVMLPQETSHL